MYWCRSVCRRWIWWWVGHYQIVHYWIQHIMHSNQILSPFTGVCLHFSCCFCFCDTYHFFTWLVPSDIRIQYTLHSAYYARILSRFPFSQYSIFYAPQKYKNICLEVEELKLHNGKAIQESSLFYFPCTYHHLCLQSIVGNWGYNLISLGLTNNISLKL